MWPAPSEVPCIVPVIAMSFAPMIVCVSEIVPATWIVNDPAGNGSGFVADAAGARTSAAPRPAQPRRTPS